MDIPPTLIKNLTADRIPTKSEVSPGAALAKTLGIHLSTKVEATITQVSKILGHEQKELLDFHASSKALPAKLHQKLMDLLSSPQLKLVALDINGKPLSSFTDLNLTVGQKILAKVTPQGQLVLIPEEAPKPPKQSGSQDLQSTNPRQTAQSTTAPAPQQAPLNKGKTQLTTPQATLQVPKSSGQLPQPPLASKEAASKNVNKHPSQGGDVKQAPTSPSTARSAQPENPLTRINQTSVDTKPLPSNFVTSQQQTTGSTASNREVVSLTSAQKNLISQATTQLMDRVPTSATKIMDSLLKVTPLVGEFAQDIKGAKSAIFPNDTLLAIKNLLSQPLRPHQSEQLPQRILTALQNSGVFYEHKIVQASEQDKTLVDIEHDLKWQLQQITALASNPNSKPLQEHSYDKLLQTLFTLLTQHKTGNKRNSSPKESAVTDLKLLLGVLANKALGKLQLNQYQNLAQKQTDSSVLQTEIPIRLADHVLPVKIEIREKSKHDDSEKEEKKRRNKKKASHWSVFLEMDLNEEDVLAAKIDILDEKLNLKFWANSETLRNKTRSDMKTLQSELKDSGLNVTEMHCTNVDPPEKESSIDWNLIDVQT